MPGDETFRFVRANVNDKWIPRRVTQPRDLLLCFFLFLSLHVLRVLLIYTTFQFSNFYQIEPEFSSIGTSSTVFTKMGMVSYYYNDDLIIVIEF